MIICLKYEVKFFLYLSQMFVIFNSFTTSMCFALFETIIFQFFRLTLKSKLAISPLVANFAFANLAVKYSELN